MKKRFSMLIVLSMLLTSLVPSFTANAAFTDVDSSNPYNEAIATLSTLKVINGYDDNTFAPDKEISRAEFTKMIVYMLGLGDLNSPITQFNDVPQTHWANGNIKTAYDLGIINGFDDTTFKPDDPVTYEQALKMVVCTLGYQTYAEQSGGYPKGYQEQASLLELNKNVSNLAYNANASRAVIAQVMYNALEVKMLDYVNGKYTTTEKTLLNDYLKVASLKGVLVGVESSTTADCNVALNPGEMAVMDSKDEIHVINFSESGKSISELIANLGRTVQVYYRGDKLSDDKSLVDFSSEVYKNKEITLNSTDISEVSGNTIKYRTAVDSKTTSVRFESNPSVRYNGRAVPESDVADKIALLDNFYGTVRLVSNDSSDKYTMLDIYNYEVMVAQRAVTSSDYRLTNKLVTADYITLDPDSTDYTFTLTRDGAEVEPTKIATNDVVLVATDDEGSYYTVKASSKTVSGKIDSINTTKKTLKIGDKTYNYTDSLVTSVEKENAKLGTGVQLKAYLDDFGTIQYGTVSVSETYYPYAYVIDTVSEGEDCYLKLFAPSSTSSTSALTSSTSYKVKSYKLADKVKYNDSKKSGEGVVSALAETGYCPDTDETGCVHQIIRVGFNTSGQIDTVITAQTSDTDNGKNIDPSKLIKYDIDTNNYTVTSSSIKSGSTTLYSIKSTTPLFVIPDDRTDSDKYAIKPALSSSSLKSGDTLSYLDAFDINKSNQPSCLVIYGREIESGTPITIDTKYSLLLDDAEDTYDTATGESLMSFTVFDQTNSTSTKKVAADLDVTGIGKGDVVLFAYDGDGYVKDYDIVMDYDRIADVLTSGNYDWNTGFRYFKPYYDNDTEGTNKRTEANMYNVLQVITDEEPNKLYVTKNAPDASEDYESINITSSTKIVRYDKDLEEFVSTAPDSSQNLTINDIYDIENYGSECSKIMVVSYYSSSTADPAIRFIVMY